MTERRARDLGGLVLRCGVGALFLLFGVDKFLHPSGWLIFVPGQLSSLLNAHPQVTLYEVLWVQGFLEAVLGIQLVLGIFTRASALGCAAFLAVIIYGLGETSVQTPYQIPARDASLLVCCLALAVLGGGAWSLDAWMHRSAPS